MIKENMVLVSKSDKAEEKFSVSASKIASNEYKIKDEVSNQELNCHFDEQENVWRTDLEKVTITNSEGKEVEVGRPIENQFLIQLLEQEKHSKPTSFDDDYCGFDVEYRGDGVFVVTLDDGDYFEAMYNRESKTWYNISEGINPVTCLHLSVDPLYHSELDEVFLAESEFEHIDCYTDFLQDTIRNLSNY